MAGVPGAEHLARRAYLERPVVGLLDDVGLARLRDEKDPSGAGYPVGSGGPCGEGERVARLESLLALRCPHHGGAGEDDEPFLDAVVEVIRGACLSLVELVEGRAHLLRTQGLAETPGRSCL